MNDNTVMKSPPIIVTAPSGILSKNPTLPIASIISCGRVIVFAPPIPAELIIVETTPCTILNIASISSIP